jgi:hypothetical protein
MVIEKAIHTARTKRWAAELRSGCEWSSDATEEGWMKETQT